MRISLKKFWILLIFQYFLFVCPSKLIDMLEDNDDVQNVWHNWENED